MSTLSLSSETTISTSLDKHLSVGEPLDSPINLDHLEIPNVEISSGFSSSGNGDEAHASPPLTPGTVAEREREVEESLVAGQLEFGDNTSFNVSSIFSNPSMRVDVNKNWVDLSVGGYRCDIPNPDDRIWNMPKYGMHGIPLIHFDYGLRLPLHPFFLCMFEAVGCGIAQMTPNIVAQISGFIARCAEVDRLPSLNLFFSIYNIHYAQGQVYFYKRAGVRLVNVKSSNHGWHGKWLFWYGKDLEFMPSCRAVPKDTTDLLNNLSKYDATFLEAFLGTWSPYNWSQLKDESFLGGHNLSGRSLRQVLDEGLKDEIDKASMLIAKRPRSQLPRGDVELVPGGSVNAASGSVPIAGNTEDVVLSRGEDIELITRERKKSRVKVTNDDSERVAARRGQEPAKSGAARSLTITGLRGGDRPPVFQPDVAVDSARFEVQPFESWTVGSHVPLRVFGAFDLPQDFSSYVDRAHGDVADRCLTRAERFLADMTHIVREYRADVDGQWRAESIREMTTLKEQRVAAERRAKEAEKRVGDLTLELEKLKVEAEGASQSVDKLSDELRKAKELNADRQRESDRVGLELDRCRSDKDTLANEVSLLKAEVAKGVEEIANGLEAGYGHC
ncbi:hypothetical protein POM88_024730 [Heracleum sosnowskyi]|uniref:Transposase (putative) gypsy type domain-containing protein n=1 Tax=Heracleum sosnowskyi TaxID=360622 RepID=A0AAD8MLQ2_9APIA|nr:hypothetical protein POM88_024730 [Heracleum sosnowskyi]